jgi:hypothetical protein
MSAQHPQPPLQVTVMFEPNRLAPATLHQAYALLLPYPSRPHCFTSPLLAPQLEDGCAAEEKGASDEDGPARAVRPRLLGATG